MRTITIQKTRSCPEKVKTSVLLSDSRETISEPCIVYEEGVDKPLVLYTYAEVDTSAVLHAVRNIEYVKGKRARGLYSISRIFGYRPRLTMHHDYCSITSLAFDSQEKHEVICDFAKEIERVYRENIPDVYEKHKEMVSSVLPEWRIKDTVYTSGIVNKNNQLKYHHDTGNFNEVYSAMLVLRSGTRGGNLLLPEYGVQFQLKNNAIFIFDGQSVLHGVTPIFYDYPEAYRYSLVYYSLKQIAKCLPLKEELERIREVKMKRELIRHTMPEEHRKYLEKHLAQKGY